MNAVHIIERLHECDADLAVEGDKLVVRGRGKPLPSDLEDALREHKAELMVALGVPMERTIAEVLREIRPQLPPVLRTLPDSSLLVLVNWAIIAAWNRTVRDPHLRVGAGG
jgi:hypothetical protein